MILTEDEQRLELLGQSESIYNDFYDLSSKLKLEYIKRYVSDINWKIDYIFETIKRIHDNTLLEVFLREMKAVFLMYFYLGDRKTFEGMLDDYVKRYILQKDSERFYQNFKDNYIDIRNRMTNLFQKYYACVLEQGKKEDYKELYAYYQTLLMSLLYMLPQSYAKKLLQTDDYEGIRNGMKIYKYDETLEDINTKAVYLDSLDLSIRKNLCDKYNLDTYNKAEVLKKSI